MTLETNMPALIKAHIKAKYGQQKVAAHRLGLSTAYINQQCSGRTKPSQVLLNDMNLTRVVTVSYLPKEQP